MKFASIGESGWRLVILFAFFFGTLGLVFAILPIPQDPAYHAFVDVRSYLGISNFLNVVSNLPFVLIGMFGVRSSVRRCPGSVLPAWIIFFQPFLVDNIASGPIMTGLADTSWYFEFHSETGWTKMNDMKYLVFVEKSETSFGAYVPDLPGCVAVAETKEELVKLIREAIEFHIEGLRADNMPVPKPSSGVEFVDVAA